MARTLVESLKRLYEKERLTKAQIGERVAKDTITPEEYRYITGTAYKSK